MSRFTATSCLTAIALAIVAVLASPLPATNAITSLVGGTDPVMCVNKEVPCGGDVGCHNIPVKSCEMVAGNLNALSCLPTNQRNNCQAKAANCEGQEMRCQ